MPEIKRYAHGKCYTCKPDSRGTYYIHWTDGRRSKRESTRTKDVVTAQAFLDEWVAIANAHVPEQVWTCEDLWNEKYGRKGGERWKYAWANLGPHFGNLRPIEVTQAVEDAYARKRKVAPSTLRLELSLLRAAWNHGLKRGYITASDLPNLGPLPDPSPPRERWLSDAEVDRLFAIARHRPRVWMFLHLALETAARRTAIQELTWDQVDWDAGVIHYLKPGERQSRKRKASVPISKTLLPVLREAQAHATDEFVIGAGGNVNEALAAAAAKAKVNGVTPHVLRHTAATRMARAGVSLWIIAKVLGNTVEQVEKVYAKYQPGMAREAVEAISGRRAA